jgi:hypothetical protein
MKALIPAKNWKEKINFRARVRISSGTELQEQFGQK